MRNYVTGNTVDKTFRAGSTVIHLSLCFFFKEFDFTCLWLV
jgi:hypothetical protein